MGRIKKWSLIYCCNRYAHWTETCHLRKTIIFLKIGNITHNVILIIDLKSHPQDPLVQELSPSLTEIVCWVVFMTSTMEPIFVSSDLTYRSAHPGAAKIPNLNIKGLFLFRYLAIVINVSHCFSLITTILRVSTSTRIWWLELGYVVSVW